MWVQCGDQNTSFFHNSILLHNHHSSISLITNSNGNCFTDNKDIEKVFCDFFLNLWTVSSDNSVLDVFQALSNDLPLLSPDDCDHFVSKVSKKEVFHALQILPLGKSPSPNGLNSEFYHFFWNDIRNSLFESIKHFLDNSIIPKAWGFTFITLSPKTSNPKLVSNFRPISLCNVCYKIISKILPNQLKSALPLIIGRKYCGFVSDHSSFDNIIALQEVLHTMDRDFKNPLGC